MFSGVLKFICIYLYVYIYIYIFVCVCVFLQTQQSHCPQVTQQSHCPQVTWMRQAFHSSQLQVATVHTFLFSYCINCCNNSVIFIYSLANKVTPRSTLTVSQLVNNFPLLRSSKLHHPVYISPTLFHILSPIDLLHDPN